LCIVGGGETQQQTTSSRKDQCQPRCTDQLEKILYLCLTKEEGTVRGKKKKFLNQRHPDSVWGEKSLWVFLAKERSTFKVKKRDWVNRAVVRGGCLRLGPTEFFDKEKGGGKEGRGVSRTTETHRVGIFMLEGGGDELFPRVFLG